MQIEQVDGVAVIRWTPAPGASDVQLAEQWERDLRDTAERIDPPLLVLDMTGVVQLGPRTLAGLVRTQRRLRERGGQLWLAGVSAPLADVLQITGFARELRLAESCTEAVREARRSG